MRVIDSTIQPSLDLSPGAFSAVQDAGVVTVTASQIQVSARCKATATDPSETDSQTHGPSIHPRFAPSKVGWMQIGILETNWAYYKGMTESDGCVLNDFTMASGSRLHRDYDRMSGAVWYEATKNPDECYGVPDRFKPSPWNLELYFGDKPKTDIHEAVRNTATQTRNYLFEAKVALGFLTTLTEESSPGVFRHLRHFFWSITWHIQAPSVEASKQRRPFNILGDSAFWISDFKRGAPREPRYLAALNDTQLTPSYNEAVASRMPAKSTSSTWERFPVMNEPPKRL